jgi:hypothetical protein
MHAGCSRLVLVVLSDSSHVDGRRGRHGARIVPAPTMAETQESPSGPLDPSGAEDTSSGLRVCERLTQPGSSIIFRQGNLSVHRIGPIFHDDYEAVRSKLPFDSR